jgi:hypothetical protein
MMRRQNALLAPLLALLAAAPAAAQQPDGVQEWLLGWTPLVRVADLPRGLTGMLHGAGSLLGPAPLIGDFWTGRNPAALPWQVADNHGQIALRSAGADGEYHRPLDAPAAREQGLQVFGWQRVSEGGALAGHTAFSETRTDPGPLTLEFHPHGSGPFLLTDTTTTPTRTQRARLDGAGGWQLGRTGVGISLGLETGDAFTTAAQVPRTARAARRAAALGVSHDLGPARLGAYARWSRADETRRTSTNWGVTQVVVTRGFAAPAGLTLTPTSQPRWVYRRSDADGRAAGVAAAGAVRGWNWSGYAEAGRLAERNTYQEVVDAPIDRWDATGVSGGAGAQRPLGSLMLTLRGDVATATGTAYLADGETPIYHADELAVRGSGEVRWQPAASAWHALAGAGVAYESRERGDTVSTELHTRLESLTMQARGEVAYGLTPALRLAAGYALTSYAPRGSIPGTANYPTALLALAGGETAFYATRSLGHSASLGGLWEVRAGTAVQFTTRYQRMTPRAGAVTLEMAPQGVRTIWDATLAVIIR